MNNFTAVPEVGARRLPTWVDRVICWRVGPVVLDRCRECVYLVRLEGARAGDPGPATVVCTDRDPALQLDLAW